MTQEVISTGDNKSGSATAAIKLVSRRVRDRAKVKPRGREGGARGGRLGLSRGGVRRQSARSRRRRRTRRAATVPCVSAAAPWCTPKHPAGERPTR
ncbi:unnamed protein product [Danaus chrysippus]|uniref:(African queen) hypothetical protein n=1 Tax=Danaus chrysippus TaxID=151541 RepID=A0A8J2R660_9NEOP|nr:unnamed protein product [Danaus chrysippus]